MIIVTEKVQHKHKSVEIDSFGEKKKWFVCLTMMSMSCRRKACPGGSGKAEKRWNN